MSEEQNSQPDAPNSEVLNQKAGVEPEAAAESVRGRRRSRRSTSAPTTLRQAAELLHTAPAAAADEGGKSRQSSARPARPGAAGPDAGTGAGPREGAPSAPPSGRSGTGSLPRTAAEDDPRAWGDAPEDTSAWLREQRPPHWG